MSRRVYEIIFGAALFLAVVLITGSCGKLEEKRPVLEGGYRGVVLDRPIPKVDFTLLDTEGKPFDFKAETEGYLTLLFFGYTYCPDICPVHLANLAEVLKGMPWEVQSKTRVVFVTIDPARDTPERIRQWLDAFDSKFIGLTGSIEEVNEIMVSLGMPPAVIEDRGNGDYAVGHASQVIAFAPDGIARVIYPFGTRQTDWAHDLPVLVRSGAGVEVERAYVAAPVGGGDRTALYLTLVNQSTIADTLVAVSSEAAGRAELHTQAERNGMVMMEPVESLVLPARGELRLEPGGHHIMLLELNRAIQPGDTVRTELVLSRGGTVPVMAEVRSYADLEAALGADPTGGHHSGGGH